MGGRYDNQTEVILPTNRNLTSSRNPDEDPGSRDIGVRASTRIIQSNIPTPAELKTEKQRVLYGILKQIGTRQVNRSELIFAPPWVLEEAFEREHNSNWSDAYVCVPEAEVERKANLITSHVVYKVKTDEKSERTMKARIVPHGNRDKEKDDIRKDSATVQLDIIRLLLSLTTFMGFRLAAIDITGAYLQIGPINRNIYVRPPKEWNGVRGVLWKLTKLPYGVVEAVRQWMKVVDEWMLTYGGLERILGIGQFYVKRIEGKIILLLAKLTDDFLLSSTSTDMIDFIRRIQKRFVVGKVVVDQKILFSGCEIEQDQQVSINFSMHHYMDRLRLIHLDRKRRKELQSPVTEVEKKAFRSLAGTLLYLENAVMPQASLIASLMQQRISCLKVQDIFDANTFV